MLKLSFTPNWTHFDRLHDVVKDFIDEPSQSYAKHKIVHLPKPNSTSGKILLNKKETQELLMLEHVGPKPKSRVINLYCDSWDQGWRPVKPIILAVEMTSDAQITAVKLLNGLYTLKAMQKGLRSDEKFATPVVILLSDGPEYTRKVALSYSRDW